MIDLLVAGGGPVGLGTALLARRHGLRVAVAEPRPTPIDKACGEGLMPGAVAALRALGVEPPGRPFVGIRYLDEEHRADGRFAGGSGLGVRRTALHASLADAADAAGIEVIPAHVMDVQQRAGHVAATLGDANDRRTGGPTLRPGGGSTPQAGSAPGDTALPGRGIPRAPLEARYVAVADGLHSRLRDRLGLALPTSGPRRYGLRQHFHVQAWSDFVEVYWARAAEAYVTPVDENIVGVALLCTGQAPFADRLEKFPLLRQRLAGASAVSPVRGAGPLRQRARSRVAGRALLVGDAAGYVDAITGEGIRLGLAEGAELVRCVAADRPADYERAWLRTSREYRLLSDALVRAGRRPWLRSRIVAAAAALPGVFERIIGVVAE